MTCSKPETVVKNLLPFFSSGLAQKKKRDFSWVVLTGLGLGGQTSLSSRNIQTQTTPTDMALVRTDVSEERIIRVRRISKPGTTLAGTNIVAHCKEIVPKDVSYCTNSDIHWPW
jgi:hypothetical protein